MSATMLEALAKLLITNSKQNLDDTRTHEVVGLIM